MAKSLHDTSAILGALQRPEVMAAMAAALQAALAVSSPVAGGVGQGTAEAMAVDEPSQRHQGKQAAIAALPPASTPVEQALMDMIFLSVYFFRRPQRVICPRAIPSTAPRVVP